MAPGRSVKLFWYLEIVPRLGIWNVIYVLYYRLWLKSGSPLRKNPVIECKGVGPLFAECKADNAFPDKYKVNLLKQADRIISGDLPYFSHHWIRLSSPPNWFLNPMNGKECQDQNKHWSEIPDFDSELGDIKCVWEASRYTWMGILARAYKVSGKKLYLDTLNHWIDNWINKNPLNQGPNWKCGQEASFRVMALLNAANILDQTELPSEKLMEMIVQHLTRISSTITYATAQRNNHATSEAAALFIGGSWLFRVNAPDRQRNGSYARKGRKAMERLVRSLTYEDGSFSQHSVVYHRLFLDTVTSVIFWAGKLSIQEFTPGFYKSAQKAFDWLYALVDESGDCPNLGPNDGTLLQSNHSCDYRDFRPSLQLASALIRGQLSFEEGPHDESLYWFGIKNQYEKPEPYRKPSRVFQSGYVLMNGRDSWALLRFPYFNFRPSHNDAMHFDLWANGTNLLIDSGSYSYNPDKDDQVPDLKSVHSHNSLSFDHKEQMPRLGRFLLAKWLKPVSVGDIVKEPGYSGAWEGSYKDADSNLHRRKVLWHNQKWEIQDKFTGKAKKVEIGFNFENCKHSVDFDSNTLLLPWGKIVVSKEAELTVRSQLISKYYFQSQDACRLVISSPNNSEVRTSIHIF